MLFGGLARMLPAFVARCEKSAVCMTRQMVTVGAGLLYTPTKVYPRAGGGPGLERHDRLFQALSPVA